MKVSFVGGFFPKSKIPEYIKYSLGEVHFAANSFQQSIISGLRSHDDVQLSLITVPFLTNYPSYKKIFIKKEQVDECEIVPFLNIKLIDSVTKSINLRKSLKRNFQKTDEGNIIIIYGLFDYFLLALPKRNNSKVCLIVPDLPRMMGGDLSKFKIKLYIKFVELIINKNLCKIDSFVFISKYMHEVLNIYNKPWIVLEGIYDNTRKVEQQLKEINTTILYTGTLDRRYGILDLLKAFSNISDNSFRLWICGEGIGRKEVEDLELKDKRVKYFGQISNEEALILQRKATILVNPRKNDSDYTKFSFPSKTMEYLASGTPTIMYVLDGIPEEYHKFFFTPKDNTVKALTQKILEVADMREEDREYFGAKAAEFILKHKNSTTQVSKIIKMLKKM